jgi:hypothetical protein
MTSSWRVAAALTLAILAAGCDSTQPGPPQAAQPAPLAQLSPATSLASAGGTWASVPMGGTGPNLFWQLFELPSADGRWSLQTPPAIATNGALILAAPDRSGQDAKALIVGIRPSLDLTYSPVMTTSNGGGWGTIPPDPGLADVPDALAAAPDGHLIALDEDQRVGGTSSATADWTTLTSREAVAATPAGRQCTLTGLTAVAYTPAGAPLLGGACGKAGTVGIFAYSAGTWHLAGPSLPASLTGSRIQVLRLSRTGDTDMALLEAGSGSSATLIAAWTADNGRRWTLSPALRLGNSQPVSASFGGSGATAVVLSGNRGEILDGPDGSWRPLPALPPGRSITLALPAAHTVDALAADGSTLTVWRLGTGSAIWSKVQDISVPIQYGSSS